jgi:hypothetical protein
MIMSTCMHNLCNVVHWWVVNDWLSVILRDAPQGCLYEPFIWQVWLIGWCEQDDWLGWKQELSSSLAHNLWGWQRVFYIWEEFSFFLIRE